MKLIRKIIVYIICLFTIFNYTYGFENKIEFQLANKSFTSNDLEKRENYLKFVGDNSQLSKKEIINDYVSVLIFYEYYLESKNKLELEETSLKIYNEILTENKKNNKFNEYSFDKDNIVNNLKLDLIRKNILENFLNRKKEEIFIEKDDINLIYNFTINYLNIYQEDLINKDINIQINEFKSNEDLEKYLNQKEISYFKNSKSINDINKINKVIKKNIDNNNFFFTIYNEQMISVIDITKKFETYNGLSATILSFKTNQKIDKDKLTCNNLKNNDNFKIIVKNYKYSELNEKIKNNLINLNDYILISGENFTTYVILCGITFDKEILNNISINKKINQTIDNIEKSFVNKYSNEYNLIIYDE